VGFIRFPQAKTNLSSEPDGNIGWFSVQVAKSKSGNILSEDEHFYGSQAG